jgi:hypothetical protein
VIKPSVSGICVAVGGIVAVEVGVEVSVGVDVGIEVLVEIGVEVGASAVWVANIEIASWVAAASNSTWDGTQALKNPLAAKTTNIENKVFLPFIIGHPTHAFLLKYEHITMSRPIFYSAAVQPACFPALPGRWRYQSG